jgi:hypothetical protein
MSYSTDPKSASIQEEIIDFFGTIEKYWWRQREIRKQQLIYKGPIIDI